MADPQAIPDDDAWLDDEDGEPPLDTTPQTIPLPSSRIGALSCGEHFSAVVCTTDEGPRLFTWGRSSAGRLGRTDEATDSPGIVSSVPNAAIASLGQDHGACVSSDGVLRTWGSCQSGQLGTGDVKVSGEVSVVEGVGTVTDVACGFNFTACVNNKGEVYSWGAASSGQLGHETLFRVAQPQRVARLPEPVVRISCGDAHTLALARSGVVFAWGCGDEGQLGDGRRTTQDAPTPLTSFFAEHGPASSVACGAEHSAAIAGRGQLFTWGRSQSSQLGLGTTDSVATPQLVQELVNESVEVAAVSLGVKYSVAVTAQQAMYLWGDFHFGIHLGGAGKVSWEYPECVVAAGVVDAVAAGRTHILARTVAGEVVMWGFVTAAARKPLADALGADLAVVDQPSASAEPSGNRGADSVALPAAVCPPHDAGDAAGAGSGGGVGANSQFGSDSLDSLAAILEMSPQTLSKRQPSLTSTPAPRRAAGAGAGDGDGDGTSNTAGGYDGATAGAPSAHTSLEAMACELEEARGLAEFHAAAAAEWKRKADEAQRRVSELEAQAPLSANDDSTTPTRMQLKLQELAVAVVQARVSNAANVIASLVKRNHLALTACAFRRWCATAGTLSRRPARHTHTALPLLRCISRLGRKTLWGAFQRWRRGLDWARAEEVFASRSEGLREEATQARRGKKLANQRVKYMRNVMTGRLIKTQLRYGRDKVVAVLHARSRFTSRIAFERWRLHTEAQQRSEGLKRGRVKLQVRLDQVRAQRGQYERSQRELGHAKRLFSAFVAFHKWKTLQAEAKHQEAVEGLQQERRTLIGQLEALHQHMESVRQAQESEQRAATARGGTVLEDVKALEERILSWYKSEDAGAEAGVASTLPTWDPSPSGTFVVGPASLSQSRAYDMARSAASGYSPPPAQPVMANVHPPPGTTATSAASRQGPADIASSRAHSVAGLLADAGLHGLDSHAVSAAPSTSASPNRFVDVPAFTFSAMQAATPSSTAQGYPTLPPPMPGSPVGGFYASQAATPTASSILGASMGRSGADGGNFTIRSLLGGTAHELAAARQVINEAMQQ